MNDHTAINPGFGGRRRFLLPGAQLGPYTIKDRLGTGGAALVYRAVAPDGRAVAIKIPKITSPGANLLKRFHRERRVLTTLQHPAIVRVLDTGLTKREVPYLVLELVLGGDLLDVLHRRPDRRLSSAETVYLVRRCAEALAVAHGVGLIHRDVKPGNLLVTRAGEVKLTDFGIALSVDDSVRLTEPGHVVGTALYLSPELFRDDLWSAAADIYSLGAVAYQVLAGRPPLELERTSESFYQDLMDLKLNRAPDPLDRFAPLAPPPLLALVNWMLNNEPHDRPAAGDVVRFLDDQLPGLAAPIDVRGG